MSKKLISALLVLFMVLNLIAGFPVMAEETAGGTAEAISENEPAAEEIFENDAAPAVYVDEEPAAVPEESAAACDIEAGEQEETAEAQEEQPVYEKRANRRKQQKRRKSSLFTRPLTGIHPLPMSTAILHPQSTKSPQKQKQRIHLLNRYRRRPALQKKLRMKNPGLQKAARPLPSLPSSGPGRNPGKPWKCVYGRPGTEGYW